MQTFLPYADFRQTAKCLDYRRLGKQRSEAKILINVIEKLNNGITHIEKNGKKVILPWSHHPATKMWQDNLECLKVYYNVILEEWINRGYKNNMTFYANKKLADLPTWIGMKNFHDSHKSNLLRKDFKYYSQFNWNVKNDLPYCWGEE